MSFSRTQYAIYCNLYSVRNLLNPLCLMCRSSRYNILVYLFGNFCCFGYSGGISRGVFKLKANNKYISASFPFRPMINECFNHSLKTLYLTLLPFES